MGRTGTGKEDEEAMVENLVPWTSSQKKMKMVKEAEENAVADKQRREKVEKRNNLDSLRVQALGQIEENASAPQDARDKLKAAANSAEEAVRSDDDAQIVEAQKRLEEELREFMTANQNAAQAEGQPEGQDGGVNMGKDQAEDDVIDADFKPAP